MAGFVDREWLPEEGSWLAHAHPDPRPYRAYVPDRLADLTVTVTGTMAADLVDLELAMVELTRTVGADPDLVTFTTVLTGLEAIASSRMEGVMTTVTDLAAYQAKVRAGRRVEDQTAAQVAANVAAIEEVLAATVTAAGDLPPHGAVPFTRDLMLGAHQTLMAASPYPEMGGRVRGTQNWIGGPWSTPPTARFVPPPPEMVEQLLADLVAFWSDDSLPVTVQAALGHVQFQTIHPFGDGNGRVGRAYLHAVHAARGRVRVPVPVSVALAARKDSYIDGLATFRYLGAPDGPEAAHAVSFWLETYISAMLRAVHDAAALSQTLSGLVVGWRRRVRPRRGSAAERVLPYLGAMPVLCAADLVRTLGVSRQAATTAVGQLVEAGVLVQHGDGQRHRWFAVPDLLEVLEEYAKGPRRFGW